MVPEGSWRHFSVNIKRDEYDTWSLRMRHEHSKSYNKQFVQTAVHLNSYSTLCLMTAALLCCYSKPSERAAICFAHPALCSCLRTPRIPCVFCSSCCMSLFAYTAHTLCIAVSSVHVTICTQIRQIGNIRNFEISCIISYQYL